MIFRAKHGRDNPYFRSTRAAAQNAKLSWAARGLLNYLLSKPDDWEISVPDLIRQGDAGKDGVYKLLNELREHGYIVRRQERERGVITRWIMDVFESPVLLPGLPDQASPDQASPDQASPDQASPDQASPDQAKPPQHKKRKYKRENTQNTHHTEAPPGAQGVSVCRVVSIHSRQTCLQYAQHLHDTGQGVDKPAAFAAAIHHGESAGQEDELITEWQAVQGAKAAKAARVAACAYCRDSLVPRQRFIKTAKQPRGAWKACTHDPEIENKFTAAD